MKPLYGKKEIQNAVNAITHLDDSSKLFFGRQLESLKAKSYDVKYPALMARQLFPMSFEADPGAKTITYEQYDHVGVAKFLASYADDLPRADIKGKEFTSSVKPIGSSYGWSIQDLRSAAMKGLPLTQKKSMAAKRSVMTKEDLAAWFGDADHNIQGFLNNPNVGTYTVPNDGTASATEWSAKTPALILRDMNGIINSTDEVTLGEDPADTLLLPRPQFNYIASTRMADGTDTTILKFFLANNPYIKDVFAVNRLLGAGSGGEDVMAAYRRSPEHLTMEVPQEYEEFPPQPKGLEAVVPCHSRFGGVLIYYPLSVAIGEGI